MDLKKYLGKSLAIYLFEGGRFYFKVTGCHDHYLIGYDDEGMELKIDVNDIHRFYPKAGKSK